MPSDPTPIMDTESVNAARRPDRSAYQPNSQPPSGRIRNPTAKIPAVFNSCAVGFSDGKNTLAKTILNAAEVYQSYHSIKLPSDPRITLPATDLVRGVSPACRWSSCMFLNPL